MNTALDSLGFGQPRSKCTAHRNRNQSSKKIVAAVLDDSNNTEQQEVLALRKAILQKDLMSICVSAGLVLDSSFLLHQYLIKNIKTVIKLLTETKNLW